jgi:hypothetical protein
MYSQAQKGKSLSLQRRGTIDKNVYLNAVEKSQLVGHINTIFQQNGVTSHFSNAVLETNSRIIGG